MNAVTFKPVKDLKLDVELAAIQIDGRAFIDIVREVELPEASRTGQPDLAGKYAYVDLPRLGDPSAHFHGVPDPGFAGGDGRVVLLACAGCGEPACWPLEARITVTADTVVWEDFRQPHRSTWSHARLGRFVFDRQEYDTALEALSP